MFGYNAAGVGPGGRSAAPAARAYLDHTLALAKAKAGAAGASPGGQVRNALSQAAQARAAAKAAAVAAMPHIGVGGLGGSRVGAGGSAAAANATTALFGGSGPPPSYGGNSFVLGLPRGAYGAGGGYTDPGARHERAIQQGANALFGMLTAPGGDAPDGPYALALADSARAVAAAKADIEAEGSLFGTGHGTLAPGNQATRAAAAQLAAELGVGPAASGRAGTRLGYPPWRFGMAQNPYLTRRLSAGSDTGGYGTSHPGGPGYTAPMAPPHMVREGFYRPRPELASPTPSGRIALDVGGGRWFNAPRAGRTRGHDGIDFEAMPGTPVLAPVDGVVTGTGKSYESEEGKPTLYFVEITSGDGHVTRTHYVDRLVKKGDRVMAGEQIGVAQDITQRYSDVPHHVHFEMRNSGKPLPTMDQIMGRTHEQSKIDYFDLSPRVDPTNLFSWPWPFEVRRPPR